MSGPVAARRLGTRKAVDRQLLIKASGPLAGLRTSVSLHGLTLLDVLKQYSAITDRGNTVIQQAIQKARHRRPDRHHGWRRPIADEVRGDRAAGERPVSSAP